MHLKYNLGMKEAESTEPCANNPSGSSTVGETQRLEYEFLFMYEATRRGYKIIPFSEGRYDCVLDNGDRLLRIQIKSSSCNQRGSYKIRTIHFKGHGEGGRGSVATYNKEKIDFLVAYIIPEETWYIFPINEVAGKQAVSVGKHTNRMEKYRDAWQLFNDGKQ